MTPTQFRLEACHNCRRQRLRCDRSVPQCLKCTKRGQECLGYQRLLRWDQGVASRGKMIGVTFEEMIKDHTKRENSSSHSSSQQSSRGSSEVSTHRSLTDPLIQDVNFASRRYLFYFASDVCRDLVLYDIPQHNPFRELIPLTFRHPVLLQIIVANSALHMSNACQKSLDLDQMTLPIGDCKSLLGTPCSTSSAIQQLESYNDALAAKQRALHLLQSALTSIDSADIDVTLAVVLLFIEFELIDSGRDNWRHHINGARTIIETLCRSNISPQNTMSPLRSCLISNCLVFDILGSTLAYPAGSGSNDPFSPGTLSLLQDAEGNHCSSFPAILLHLIRTGAQLYHQHKHPSSTTTITSLPSSNSAHQQVLLLLYTAQEFDPLVWATDLQPRSPTTDITERTSIASAHRGAVSIYLSRILLSLCPATNPPQSPPSLVADVISHLSCITPTSALFTATTWPAFIVGAETTDPTTQEWVRKRFQALWTVEPWGLIRGALGVLERIWTARRNGVVSEMGDGDWIGDLRGKGVDWLIL